jgi:phosphoglycolate phosphatase
MKFKGIIFDLDGTLADTLEDIADSVNRVLVSNGYPRHSPDKYKTLVGKGLDNLIGSSLPAEARKPEIISRCLKGLMEDYKENCLVKTKLYDGIEQLLNMLERNNISMAVLSNKAEPLTKKIADSLAGNIPFVNVMGARSDFPKKPDPAAALFISEKMGISPEEMIYMGDTDVDMITAKSAGMYAVGVLWGFRSGEELLANGADVLLEHPEDLSRVIGCQAP